MDLTRKTTKQSAVIVLLLTVLSLLIDWKDPDLRFIRLFGNPDIMPASIIIGGIIGILNLRGLAWGIESLLGAYKANTKLVILSLMRLFILSAVIIILAAMRLINLLGLLIGMTVVFAVLIKEGLKLAKQQSSDQSEGISQ
jgi:hypothetical protein